MIFSPSTHKHIIAVLDKEEDTVLELISGIARSTAKIWVYLSENGAKSSTQTADRNQFGEYIKGIDIFAKNTLAQHTSLAFNNLALATEEDRAEAYPSNPEYSIFADPLDGSNHVSYLSSCGTFFSVILKSRPTSPLVSGYALYGYQLILVLAIKNTLIITVYDNNLNQFVVADSDYKMENSGKTYSICDSDSNILPGETKVFIQELRNRKYKSRYSGVLVMDIHRILIEGGIFVSPILTSGKVKTKKYFEALAVEHIMRAANGSSIYSYALEENILLGKESSSELFSAVPLICGTHKEVKLYERIMTKI